MQAALDKATASEKVLQRKYNVSKDMIANYERRRRESMLPPPSSRSASVDKLPSTSTPSQQEPPLPPRRSPRMAGKKEQPEFEFKLPSHTPGRAKPGRTQSDRHLLSGRRPPAGAGGLFHVDDEAGEQFSSSYLTDMKAGVCLDRSDSRLSELARRNSMYPAHLQSAYAAETQFLSASAFSEQDLRRGSLVADVKGLTAKTAKLGVESPAANTRSSSRRVRKVI